MPKHGKEALIIAFITGVFGSLSVLLKDKSPVVSVIVFVITVTAVYLIVWRSMRKISKEVADPKNHPVFYTIESGLKNAFDFLPIEHEKKKQLVVRYLKIKYGLIKDVLEDTIRDDTLKDLPINIINAISETRKRMVGIAPQIFIDKMAQWDNKYTSWTMDYMYSVINSEFYKDMNLRYSACLDSVQVMVRQTFIAVENAISELNGDLDDYLDGRHDE